MSWQVENTPDELELLDGATILSCRIATVDELKQRALAEGDKEFAAFIDQDALILRVRFRKNLVVNDASEGEFQIWQDAEGNGPGFLAFTGS